MIKISLKSMIFRDKCFTWVQAISTHKIWWFRFNFTTLIFGAYIYRENCSLRFENAKYETFYLNLSEHIIFIKSVNFFEHNKLLFMNIFVKKGNVLDQKSYNFWQKSDHFWTKKVTIFEQKSGHFGIFFLSEISLN